MIMEETFKLIQEKNLLNVFEKYSDLQIKYNKDDKHYIDIKIDPYVICLEYDWKQEIWMSFLHITIDKNNEEREYPIFPNSEDIGRLIYDKVKFVKGRFIINCSVDSWPQNIDTILSNIKKNKTNLYHVFDNSTLRFPDGTMKIKRKNWKSPARLIDIHQESEKGFVQGIKKDEQPLYDNSPYLFGSNGTYVSPEEKYYVLKFKVLRPRQELFQSINEYINVEKFIREYYLPKIQRERMSSKLLEEINQRIANLKLDVITHDFDEYGAVSINATYIPIGFNSWEDYLRTII
jgi:hypothetical protein